MWRTCIWYDFLCHYFQVDVQLIFSHQEWTLNWLETVVKNSSYWKNEVCKIFERKWYRRMEGTLYAIQSIKKVDQCIWNEICLRKRSEILYDQSWRSKYLRTPPFFSPTDVPTAAPFFRQLMFQLPIDKSEYIFFFLILGCQTSWRMVFKSERKMFSPFTWD